MKNAKILHKYAESFPEPYRTMVTKSKIFSLDLSGYELYEKLDSKIFDRVSKAQSAGHTLINTPFEYTCIENQQGAAIVWGTDGGENRVILCEKSGSAKDDTDVKHVVITAPFQVLWAEGKMMVAPNINKAESYVIINKELVPFPLDERMISKAMSCVIFHITVFVAECAQMEDTDDYVVRVTEKDKKQYKNFGNFSQKPYYILKPKDEIVERDYEDKSRKYRVIGWEDHSGQEEVS